MSILYTVRSVRGTSLYYNEKNMKNNNNNSSDESLTHSSSPEPNGGSSSSSVRASPQAKFLEKPRGALHSVRRSPSSTPPLSSSNSPRKQNTRSTKEILCGASQSIPGSHSQGEWLCEVLQLGQAAVPVIPELTYRSLVLDNSELWREIDTYLSETQKNATENTIQQTEQSPVLTLTMAENLFNNISLIEKMPKIIAHRKKLKEIFKKLLRSYNETYLISALQDETYQNIETIWKNILMKEVQTAKTADNEKPFSASREILTFSPTINACLLQNSLSLKEDLEQLRILRNDLFHFQNENKMEEKLKKNYLSAENLARASGVEPEKAIQISQSLSEAFIDLMKQLNNSSQMDFSCKDANDIDKKTKKLLGNILCNGKQEKLFFNRNHVGFIIESLGGLAKKVHANEPINRDKFVKKTVVKWFLDYLQKINVEEAVRFEAIFRTIRMIYPSNEIERDSIKPI